MTDQTIIKHLDYIISEPKQKYKYRWLYLLNWLHKVERISIEKLTEGASSDRERFTKDGLRKIIDRYNKNYLEDFGRKINAKVVKN